PARHACHGERPVPLRRRTPRAARWGTRPVAPLAHPRAVAHLATHARAAPCTPRIRARLHPSRRRRDGGCRVGHCVGGILFATPVQRHPSPESADRRPARRTKGRDRVLPASDREGGLRAESAQPRARATESRRDARARESRRGAHDVSPRPRDVACARSRPSARAAARASASARRLSGEAHADALATLDAVLTLVDGDHLNAAKLFGDLARRYLARSDAVTAVTLLLWRSVAYRNANAPKGAKAAASEACALRRKGPVRVSPSWWAREVVEAARLDGGDRCAGDLLQTTVGILDVARQAVELN